MRQNMIIFTDVLHLLCYSLYQNIFFSTWSYGNMASEMERTFSSGLPSHHMKSSRKKICRIQLKRVSFHKIL